MSSCGLSSPCASSDSRSVATRRGLLTLISSAVLGGSGFAEEFQGFDESFGFPFTNNGTAAVDNGSLRLAGAVADETGSVVSVESFDLPDERITVEFDFKMSGGSVQGICLALLDATQHDDDALFGKGGPSTGALVIELSRIPTVNQNHVWVRWDGTFLTTQPVDFPLDSDEWLHAAFTMDGPSCSVTLTSAQGVEQVVIDELSLDGFFESRTLRVGFGATAAIEAAEQRVDNIRINRPGGYRWHLDGVVYDDGVTAEGTFVYNPATTWTGEHAIRMSTGRVYVDYDHADPGYDTFIPLNDRNEQLMFLDFVDRLSLADKVAGIRPGTDSGPSFESRCNDPSCTDTTVERRVVEGRAIRLPDGWTNHGGAVAGAAGRPLLWGDGDLTSDSPFTLEVSGGPASSMSLLIIGFDLLDAPYKGGTLIPTPDLLVVNPLDESGTSRIDALWPPDLPSDVDIYWQSWIADSTAPRGKAATNGLQTTTP